tara:strand:+ start:518 stop:661 length:144 start_codon:yes stop_codon:yes gene_type:complete
MNIIKSVLRAAMETWKRRIQRDMEFTIRQEIRKESRTARQHQLLPRN